MDKLKVKIPKIDLTSELSNSIVSLAYPSTTRNSYKYKIDLSKYNIDSVLNVYVDILEKETMCTFNYNTISKDLDIKCDEEDWKYMTHLILEFYSIKEQRNINIDKILK